MCVEGIYARPCLVLHSLTASLNPWQRVRSACPWAHFTNSLHRANTEMLN